jgi:outer membrane protein
MIKNIFLASAFLMALASLIISINSNRKSTVYVNAGRIYEEFSLSKELNKELGSILNTRKFILDSLVKDLQQQTAGLNERELTDKKIIAKFSLKEEELVRKRELFEKESQTTANDYNARIWNQINQYLFDYGDDNNYTFILGANGQGNIMYGSKKNEITDEIIKYINDRYEDKIKK